MSRFKSMSARRMVPAVLLVLGLSATFAIRGAIGADKSELLTGGRGTLTANLAYYATWRGAQEDMFRTIADCANDPEENLTLCVQEAEDAIEDALDEANDQRTARLAILALIGDVAYDPEIDEEDFTSDVDNPLFPLVPGQRLIYEKQTANGLERFEMEVLQKTVIIDEVECRAVRAIETLDGELKEDTTDWYAQDDDGAVWYFGEIVFNYEDGFLDNIDGSWRADVDGAKPGILMPANPVVGDAFRVEFYFNEAEDFSRVIGIGETFTTPAGTFTNCIRIEDSTPLDPGNIEHKIYAPGVGLIAEFDPSNGETLMLIKIEN